MQSDDRDLLHQVAEGKRWWVSFWVQLAVARALRRITELENARELAERTLSGLNQTIADLQRDNRELRRRLEQGTERIDNDDMEGSLQTLVLNAEAMVDQADQLERSLAQLKQRFRLLRLELNGESTT